MGSGGSLNRLIFVKQHEWQMENVFIGLKGLDDTILKQESSNTW